MKKQIMCLLMALVLLVVPMVVMGVSTSLPVSIDISNSCPEILDVNYDIDTNSDPALLEWALDNGWAGRSYLFEGETITFTVVVEDTDGITENCVKAFVTLALDGGEDEIEVACVRTSIFASGTKGRYTCIYTVEPAISGTQGNYWISVSAIDECGGGCTDTNSGILYLYLNPAVSLSIESQQTFGFMYNEGGDDITGNINAGNTVYSPTFRLENSADPTSGLYMFLKIYGEDMWDYSPSDGLCPTSNVLTIDNVDYKASKGNIQQDWTEMPRRESNVDFIFDNMLGNFVGIGDDVTMRMRLNIPSPCQGNFGDGGEIVFVGQII